MFIETEGTPNPATLKFLPGREVMGLATADFASPATAERSPLASALFTLPGVARVFLGGDFITVTKTDGADWPAAHLHLHLAPVLRAPGMRRHLAAAELGAGVFIVSIDPHQAAADLRSPPRRDAAGQRPRPEA